MWKSAKAERARQSVFGTQGRSHPPGFQYWASPRPSNDPASRDSEEKGAVSIRTHSDLEHHLLASETDLEEVVDNVIIKNCDITCL